MAGFDTESDSPFSKKIREGLMPRSFRLPRSLESYNGMGDLDAFIRKYRRAMELEDVNDSLVQMLRSRPRGTCLLMVQLLTPYYIGSFGKLCSKFSTHFIGSR